MPNKTQITTQIHPTQKLFLDTLSAKTNVPIAVYVREALDLLTPKYKELIKD